MEPNPPSSTPPPAGHCGKSKLKKWLKVAGIGLAVLILLLVLIVPMIVRSVIRSQIEAAVASSLNATVEIDDLSWHPLLGVSIGHARLLAAGADGKQIPVAEMTGLSVGLASLPSGGPINVTNFELVDPTINLVRQTDGSVELSPNLLRPQTAAPASSSGPSKKPSELIYIQHFKISDMTVHVIDMNNPTAATAAWVHLDVEGTATGPADYDVHVSLDEKPLTQMTMDTSINVDGADLKFKNFSLTMQAPAEDGLAQLPPPVASFIRDKGLAGAGMTVTVADGASVTFDMTKDHWAIDGFNGKIQFTSPAGKPLADGAISYSINGGGSMPTAGTVSPLDYLATLDPNTTVSVKTDSPVSLAALPQPVTDGGFDLEFAGNKLTIKTFDADYGSQKLHLDLAATIASNKLTLTDFHLDLAGGNVGGSAADLNLVAPYDYSANLTFENIQISDVKQIVQLTGYPKLCGLASGKLNVTGTLPPGVDPLTTIKGDGDAKVAQGDFWDIPFLSDVASKVIPSFATAARVGDADAVFTLGNSKLHLSKMEVGSSILGVQGTGDVGLVGDNQLDLLVTAQPLGDWQKQLNNAGVPGLDVLGQVAGSAQGTLNKVSAQALGFRVTGPAAKPTVMPAAAGSLGGAGNGAANTVTKGAADVGSGLMGLFQPNKK
jgi:AsmA-like protein